MIDRSRLKTDLLALGLLAATVFVALSLLSHDPADAPAATVYPARTETFTAEDGDEYDVHLWVIGEEKKK
jgi:hypothetical protein